MHGSSNKRGQKRKMKTSIGKYPKHTNKNKKRQAGRKAYRGQGR